MVRVTTLNADKWKRFINAQELSRANCDLAREYANSTYNRHSSIINNIYPGISGFHDGIAFYTEINTEVWIAFASYEKIDDPNKIDDDNIEMAVTITTSKDVPFTGHMGITRSVSAIFANKPFHKDLANSLHAFAAKIMLSRYPDEKKYMITVPMPVMRTIMIKAFAESKMANAVYILDEGFNLPSLKEDLKNCLQRYLKQEEEIKEDVYSFIFEKQLYGSFKEYLLSNNYHLLSALLDQHYAIYKQEAYIPAPIVIKTNENHALNHKPDMSLTVILNDSSGELCSFQAKWYTKAEEYGKWFFGNPCQFTAMDANTPLIAVNLQQLSQLKCISGKIQHAVKNGTEDELKKLIEQGRQEKFELKLQQTIKEWLEKERLEREKAERERVEKERLEREKAERERFEKERLEREQAERERFEKERLEREQAERERVEKERLEREQAERERDEKERLEREQADRERDEKERLEREQAEREREIERERDELKQIEADNAKRLERTILDGATIGFLVGCTALYTLRNTTNWPKDISLSVCIVTTCIITGGITGYLFSHRDDISRNRREGEICY
jgi:hypothetical protein